MIKEFGKRGPYNVDDDNNVDRPSLMLICGYRGVLPVSVEGRVGKSLIVRRD